MIFSQCGSDGRTYSNTCMLNCAKQRYWADLWKWSCWAKFEDALRWREVWLPELDHVLQTPFSMQSNRLVRNQFSWSNIISSVKSISLKKSLSKWQSTEPWRPVDPRWEAGREVLQLPLYSDQGSPGGTWPLLLLWGSLILAQGSRILRWDFASFASLGILDPCSRIKDSYVEVF